jgi:hypothetical protein
MTPDERQLLTRFLQDLAQARAGEKDPEAAQVISQAMNANPDAPYLLVQHTVMSDQALHAAQGRIAELEAQLANAGQGGGGSFLGGGWRPASTAVPPTQAAYRPEPVYPSQPAYQPQPAYPPPGYAPASPFSTGGGYAG